MEETHSEEVHTERLNSLCRVCGGRSKSKALSSKSCSLVSTELQTFLSINTSAEHNSPSQTLCIKCYAKIKQLPVRQSETCVQSMKLQIERSTHLWTQFDPNVLISSCSVCAAFLNQSKGGRPKKKRTHAESEQVKLDSNNDVNISDQSFEPRCTSTPTKCPSSAPTDATEPVVSPPSPRKRLTASHIDTQTTQTSPDAKQFAHFAASPIRHFKRQELRPVAELSLPLTSQEEEYLTHLVRLKMQASEDRRTLRCKTRGQPLILKRMVMPRKPSALADSPLRKKRANQICKLRLDISGKTSGDTIKQHGTELKKSSKTTRQQIFHAAGLQKPTISRKQGSALRTGLGLSWNRYRRQRRFLKAIGVDMEGEKAERALQDEIMCGQIQTEKKLLLDETTPAMNAPIASVGSDNLPSFVTKLLDQYEEEGLLTWQDNNIPRDEIWVKVGGDHGGGSFKLMLQIANTSAPNSKNNTFLLLIVNAKDSYTNMKHVLDPYRRQFQNLERVTWKGKRIRLFLFGDYDFLLKVYGISGAQSAHPCLWCKRSKRQIQHSPAHQPAVAKRSLVNLKRDHRNFKIRGGGDKKKAKAYNNVVHRPIFDIELSQVAPPYLHVLLGVVKKHHDLLEDECHTLDLAIASVYARSGETHEGETLFGQYVNCLQTIQEHEQKKRFYETKLQGMEDERDYYKTAFDQKKQEVQDKIRKYTEKIKTKKEEAELPIRSGPVTAHLDSVLKANHITPQAYHSRSFVGNHCHQYLQTSVTQNICQSVLHKALELTEDHKIHNQASDIAEKFQQLNSKFAIIYKSVSHTLPVTDNEIGQIKSSIHDYMHFYRNNFPDISIIPKQHILECHTEEFLMTWKCGLGLLGEQGGEELHAFVNELKARVRGVNNEEERLRLLMKEQHTISSPALRSAMGQVVTPNLKIL